MDQCIKINQVVVACEGGAGLVGGVAITGGGQGQNLPAALAGLFQKVHKFICLLTHSAHAIGTGQAGDVHQNAAFTHSNFSFTNYVESVIRFVGCWKMKRFQQPSL